MLKLSNNKNKISLNGYDFLKDIKKTSVIHIYGNEDSGKTIFAKDIITLNPDKIFLYIDTYCKCNFNFDNMYIFLNNNEEKIINLLNMPGIELYDCLILDSYSNILVKESNQKIYDKYTNFLKKVIDICCKKNIVVFLINTINGYDKPYNYNNYLKNISNIEIELLENTIKNNIVNINFNLLKPYNKKYNKNIDR